LACPIVLVVVCLAFSGRRSRRSKRQSSGTPQITITSSKYFSEEIHAGRMPLWTPYIWSGYPFMPIRKRARGIR
jgi:hypothetical protein